VSRVLILGIGSPSGDDQAGWLTIDALLASGVRNDTDIALHKLDRPGVNLISLFENADWVILVDAMQSGHPVGNIRHFRRHEWSAHDQGLSSHGIGLVEALSLAHALGSLPARLDLYGIDIGPVMPGEMPGETVQAAAQKLAHLIRLDLDRPLSD